MNPHESNSRMAKLTKLLSPVASSKARGHVYGRERRKTHSLSPKSAHAKGINKMMEFGHVGWRRRQLEFHRP
jgi:hypothetical protein